MIKKIKIYKRYSLIIICCVLLYSTQLLSHAFSPTSNIVAEIPILGFHNVVHDEEKEDYYKYNQWVDGESAFIEKMQYLYDNGYHTITLNELYAWKQGTQEIDDKAFVLTFDDGYLASSTLLPQILKEYNFTATTFVIGSYIAQESRPGDGSHIQYASLQDMENQNTMKFASHTYDLHDKVDGKFKVDAFDTVALQEDFDKQKDLIDCTYVAYPFGKYSDTMIDVLASNHVKLAFGYNENKKATQNGNLYTIPRFAITAFTSMDSFQAMLES